MDRKFVVKAVSIGVALNIILSYLLSPFATKDEIKPPNGAAALSFKSQIMHMLVHHKQVLFTSSLIVAAIISLSIIFAKKI
tara:strand:+ start:270 stop:512 length:243 start_codon:yes stop_codon:yes gene_type:complete